MLDFSRIPSTSDKHGSGKKWPVEVDFPLGNRGFFICWRQGVGATEMVITESILAYSKALRQQENPIPKDTLPDSHASLDGNKCTFSRWLGVNLRFGDGKPINSSKRFSTQKAHD